MSFEEIRSVFRQLSQWLGPHSLGIGGGEPFLRSDIFQILDMAARFDIRTSFVTNASLLTEERIKKLHSTPLEHISLSLNHLDPEKHDFTRGVKGHAKKIFEAIPLLNIPDRKFRLTISTILMGFNFENVPELIMWAEKQALDGVTLQVLYYETGSAKYEQGWYENSPFWEKSPEKINRLMDTLIEMKNKGAKLINTIQQLEFMRSYLLEPENCLDLPCRVGVANFDIEPDGTVLLCDVMPPIGNIRKTPPGEIWRGREAYMRRIDIRSCTRNCRIKTCNFRKPLMTILKERIGIKT